MSTGNVHLSLLTSTIQSSKCQSVTISEVYYFFAYVTSGQKDGSASTYGLGSGLLMCPHSGAQVERVAVLWACSAPDSHRPNHASAF